MASSSAGHADAVVLDSSFLIAYHNTRDAQHGAAARAMAHFAAGSWGRGLLLEYVFLEVATVLMARRGAEVAIRVGTDLLQSDELDFVPCSELFADAWREFTRQGGRGLSFTDAAIAVAARTRAGGRVATFDADFRGLSGITVMPS